MDNLHSEALVRAAQQGSRSAFRQLYERHKQRVYRTAYRLLGDRMRAEDVTQEVFVTIHQRLRTFDFQSAFKTWVYRITVNACYDRMRKQKRRGRYHAGPIAPESPEARSLASSASDRPDHQATRSDLQQHVERALGRLSPTLRTTFVLREVEGLSYEEIAQAAGCAQGTVASRLARAREQLADRLQEISIDGSYFSQQ